MEESYLLAQRDTPASDSWTVYDRSGLKYVFGNVASAKLSRTSPCALTTAWALTHVEDPNGNSMDIIYFSYAGVLYPSQVNYGGNVAGLGHFDHVKFWYALRPPPTVRRDIRNSCGSDSGRRSGVSCGTGT